MGRRKRRFGAYDLKRPKREPLKGPVIGAILLGSPFNEEGVIAQGYASERWQLTDNVNFLLAPDDEFVVGGSLNEVREALEARYPSPVGGASLIEICNDQELKRHTMPFGDMVIRKRTKNPQYDRYNWMDRYVTTWLPDTITTLTRLCMGGTDLLVSNEAEDHIRSMPDFDSSDLVISKRDTWYSIVKYRPGKASARRKTYETIRKKEQKASDLVAAGRTLRARAAEAYDALAEDLDKFEVSLVLKQIVQSARYTYSRNDYNDPETRLGVRYLRALIRIHAAFLGKRTYRYNAVWQDFLAEVRKRPKDLVDDTWGNYRDVKEWLEAECKIKKPKPTKKMIAAQRAAEQAAMNIVHDAEQTNAVADEPVAASA